MNVDEVLAAAATGGEPVVVRGDGPLAEHLRRSLPALPDDGVPRTVIETTGSAAGLEAALAEVADLGTVVLAGPVAPARPTLDLYTDLHVRGITLIGVDPGAGAG